MPLILNLVVDHFPTVTAKDGEYSNLIGLDGHNDPEQEEALQRLQDQFSEICARRLSGNQDEDVETEIIRRASKG